MKLKQLAIIIPSLLLSASSVMAQEYQSFSSIGYTNVDIADMHDANSDRKYSPDYTNINTIYFFEKQNTLGPLDQLKYINTSSNVFGNYTHYDYVDNYNAGGDLFINNFVVGGSYSYSDQNSGSSDNYSARLGYLISDDFIVNVYADKSDGYDANYSFSTSYNHQLAGKDYIGFTYHSDDDFDHQTLSSKYFRALEGGQYLVAGVSYQHNDDYDNDLSGNVAFYFNDKTSISASYDDDDYYSLRAKHFFNQNYALGVGYSSNASNDPWSDYDIYSVNFSAQF
jgi:hypothetical protein